MRTDILGAVGPWPAVTESSATWLHAMTWEI